MLQIVESSWELLYNFRTEITNIKFKELGTEVIRREGFIDDVKYSNLSN